MKKLLLILALIALLVPVSSYAAKTTLDEAVDDTLDGNAGDSTGEDLRLTLFGNDTAQNLMNTELYDGKQDKDFVPVGELGVATTSDYLVVGDASEPAADEPHKILFPGASEQYMNGVGAFGAVNGVNVVFSSGGSISAVNVSSAIDELEASVPTEASLAVDDLKTLSGVAGGAVNLGVFTGDTIADNQTNKQAMQALESAVEGVSAADTEAMEYASIYTQASTTAVSIASADTWYQVTTFTIDGPESGANAVHGEDHITIGTTGDYLITLSGSFGGGSTDLYYVHAEKNNGATDVNEVFVSRKLGTGGDIGSFSATGIATLTAADTLEVWVYNDDAGADATFKEISLSVVKVDDVGGSWLADLVDDTTPQLGGNLDIQANTIEGVDATEFSYVDGLTSDAQTQFGAKAPLASPTFTGTLFIAEQADAAADVAGSGQIWVNTATPNELWFTDDAGTDVQLGVGGTPTAITVAATTDTTAYVSLFESATGDLGPKTDAGITYNATTNALTVAGAFTAGSIGSVAFNMSGAESNLLWDTGVNYTDHLEATILTLTANWVNTTNPWADNEVSDTLTASLFVGSGSSTTAVDLATAEVAGTLPGTDVTAASPTAVGTVELAIASEVDTGSSTALAISPDALAGSLIGSKEMAWTIYDATVDTAIDQGEQAFAVPASYVGFELQDFTCSVDDLNSAASGTTTVVLRRKRGATDADMTSTGVTIAYTEYTASDETVNTANDELALGDKIYIDIDAVTTAVQKGLSCSAVFRLP